MRGRRRAVSCLVGLAVLLAFVLPAFGAAAEGETVTILYTNDVHSYIDQELTYSLIAAYKDTLDNVLLVDAGDHIQGTAYGGMDEGASVTGLMNAAGYDLATLGNHEFDYGMEGCLAAVERAQFPYVSCNFCYETGDGAGETVLDSWRVFEVGGLRIAFVGITTPESITKATPAYFQDGEGRYLYSIAGGTDGWELYAAVQRAVDAASAQADVVIALGHLGDDAGSRPWTSEDVIANTTGLDAFIDGHSHSVVPAREVADREGNPVLLTQTGCYLGALGQMTVSADGSVAAQLLTAADLRDIEPDGTVRALEEAWISQVQQYLGGKIGSSGIDFTILFPGSTQRAVRMAETNLGDFNADAYYWYCGEAGLEVDAAIMNGGGIRSGAAPGDWSYLTCKNINTFGNVLCVVRVSGQTILDALEFGARYVGAQDGDTGARAENGGFLQVAGLTYEIDPSVENTVETDGQGVWQGRPAEYRVRNVRVYDRASGTYEPLGLDRLYTVAGANYTLLNCGDGFDMFRGAEKVLDSVGEDYLAMAAYAAAFADSDGDGYADIASANSPLALYRGYGLNYEAPAGSGRISVTEAESGGGEEPEEVTCVVAAGDSLWRIAQRYYGSGARWRDIYDANRDIIRNPDLIRVGQILVIPAGAAD